MRNTKIEVISIKAHIQGIEVSYLLNGVEGVDIVESIPEFMKQWGLEKNPTSEGYYCYGNGQKRLENVTPLDYSLYELSLIQDDRELNYYFNNLNWNNIKCDIPPKFSLYQRLNRILK